MKISDELIDQAQKTDMGYEEQTIIDRKVINSQEPIKNGQYTEFNKKFVEGFLTKAKIRHKIK
ncbi:MAG: hypothetical protein HRT38_20470 [Alteromonadaceae bacterium]|nr:hypothetical protein [Alteromonadaceae bacterium]